MKLSQLSFCYSWQVDSGSSEDLWRHSVTEISLLDESNETTLTTGGVTLLTQKQFITTNQSV